MGFKSFPHRAPFFVVDLEQRAKPAMLALYRRKIYVQDGGNWKMPSFLRISVGLPEQNEVFLEAMRELTSQPEFLAKS
jgi:histidinol-phosphate aminotransferase